MCGFIIKKGDIKCLSKGVHSKSKGSFSKLSIDENSRKRFSCMKDTKFYKRASLMKTNKIITPKNFNNKLNSNIRGSFSNLKLPDDSSFNSMQCFLNDVKYTIDTSKQTPLENSVVTADSLLDEYSSKSALRNNYKGSCKNKHNLLNKGIFHYSSLVPTHKIDDKERSRSVEKKIYTNAANGLKSKISSHSIDVPYYSKHKKRLKKIDLSSSKINSEDIKTIGVPNLTDTKIAIPDINND